MDHKRRSPGDYRRINHNSSNRRKRSRTRSRSPFRTPPGNVSRSYSNTSKNRRSRSRSSHRRYSKDDYSVSRLKASEERKPRKCEENKIMKPIYRGSENNVNIDSNIKIIVKSRRSSSLVNEPVSSPERRIIVGGEIRNHDEDRRHFSPSHKVDRYGSRYRRNSSNSRNRWSNRNRSTHSESQNRYNGTLSNERNLSSSRRCEIKRESRKNSESDRNSRADEYERSSRTREKNSRHEEAYTSRSRRDSSRERDRNDKKKYTSSRHQRDTDRRSSRDTYDDENRADERSNDHDTEEQDSNEQTEETLLEHGYVSQMPAPFLYSNPRPRGPVVLPLAVRFPPPLPFRLPIPLPPPMQAFYRPVPPRYVYPMRYPVQPHCHWGNTAFH